MERAKSLVRQYQFYILSGSIFLLIWFGRNWIAYPESFLPRSINAIWLMTYIVFASFIFFEYVLPNLSRKAILKSFILLMVQIILYSVGLYTWIYFGSKMGTYSFFKNYTSEPKAVAVAFGSALFSTLAFVTLKHIHDYIKLKQAAQHMVIEKQQSELNFLKSQTNPHFLFNTLNNIYSLARDRSDLTPQSILRLSKILRFMLYETGESFIAVEQELHIINNYIELEKLRYTSDLIVNSIYEVDDLKQGIPPLLMIPLVENAFKHGTSETGIQPFVDIHLTIAHHHLKFIVKNSTGDASNDEGDKKNIGLSNLRRQLELQYTDYHLTIQHRENVFVATLEINLNSHV